MKKVAEVSSHADLSVLAKFLWKSDVKHRIVEQGDIQEIWIQPDEQHPDIEHHIEQWLLGSELPDLSEGLVNKRFGIKSALPARVAILLKAPVTLGLIVLSVIASLITNFGGNLASMSWLLISEIRVVESSIYYHTLASTLASGELWRIWSPIFLHFTVPHLAFNLLWLFIYSTAIELVLGKRVLIPLVLVAGGLSNLAQFWVSGPVFGGMSGVVYGVLGFCWLWDFRSPNPQLYLSNIMFGLMVGWIIAGYLGLLSVLGFGDVANTAHLVGCLVGLALAYLLRIKTRGGFRLV